MVTLLEEIDARLDFSWKTVAIITARHGGAWSRDGVRAPGSWPSSLPPLAEDGGSNAAAISALVERHADAAREGRLVCIETTVLDIRGGEPASSHTRAALSGGAHLVTANKGPVAFAYRELAALARETGRAFLFEGAVMDGIPVFNLVRETLPAVRITGFRGVVNSTTNHILTRLEQGDSFDAALAQMQRDGIAEADPSLDVDGWDAAAKTAALMNVLMDARVTPHDIARQGIRGVSPDAAKAAIAAGKRLRLVASAQRSPSGTAGRVSLERVPAADPLGTLDGQQNALFLQTDLLGEVGIMQRGGGLTQTAYAVVSDLCRIARAQP